MVKVNSAIGLKELLISKQGTHGLRFDIILKSVLLESIVVDIHDFKKKFKEFKNENKI